nr:DUF4209 domain-containing protein [Nitrosomonas nitrosa]
MSDQSETPISLTAQDIRDFDFEAILSRPANSPLGRQKDHTCLNYERHFVDEAKAAEEAGDETRKHICELFATICSFWLTLDGNEPYQPKWILGGQRSLLPSDLSLSYRELLLEVVEGIEDPELQARVADVLWVVRAGNYQVASTAVDAYLNSAARLEDAEHWVEGAQRIERALQLATQLGRNGKLYEKVIEYIEDLVQKLNGDDPMWFSHRLMSLLLNNNGGEPNTYIPLTQKIAERAETAHDWRRARDYWELVATWYTKQQNDNEVYNAKLRATETYIKHANDYINQEKPVYRNASYELRYAVEALRRIRAPQEQIQQTHARLLEYQRKDDDFQKVSFSLDIREYVETARNAVKGRTLREAILTLAGMIASPSFNDLHEYVLELQKQSPLTFWISSQQLNAEGRVTAQRPGLGMDGDEDMQEQVIRAEMYKYAGMLHQDIAAQGFIMPAIYQINLEHQIRLNDLVEFVRDNPFVPPHHEEIFLQGLYYGLHGDFMLATHLLVPQIENSIRYLLKQRGVITSSLDSQGIQDDYDLGRLLYKIPEVEEMFGKDLLFDLQGLLVNRFGTNLRNLLAHGMLNAYGVTSLRTIYLWGIILRLCCYPTLIKEEAENDAQNNNGGINEQ